MDEQFNNPADAALEEVLTKACISYQSTESSKQIGFVFETYEDALAASKILKQLGCAIEENQLQPEEDDEEAMQKVDESPSIYYALECTMSEDSEAKIFDVWSRVCTEHKRMFIKAESMEVGAYTAYQALNGRVMPAYELEPLDRPYARVRAVYTSQTAPVIAVIYSAADHDLMLAEKTAFEEKYGLQKELPINADFNEHSCGFWLPKTLSYQGKAFTPPEVNMLLSECHNGFLTYAEGETLEAVCNQLDTADKIVYHGRMRQMMPDLTTSDYPGFSFN